MTPSGESVGRNRAGVGLGRTQKLVLMILAEGQYSVRDLEYHWPTLTENQIRSAIHRLERRGLVDVGNVTFERGRAEREYVLTGRGRSVGARVAEEPMDVA